MMQVKVHLILLGMSEFLYVEGNVPASSLLIPMSQIVSIDEMLDENQETFVRIYFGSLESKLDLTGYTMKQFIEELQGPVENATKKVKEEIEKGMKLNDGYKEIRKWGKEGVKWNPSGKYR